MNRRVSGGLFVVLMTMFLVCSHTLAQSPEVDRGLLWLRNNQNADGRWGNLSSFRDTSTAVDAYKMLRISDGSFLNAVNWLGANPVESNDYISRRIISLVGTGTNVNSDLQKLISSQNQDSGWGYLLGYASNAYDTAMALHAFYSAQSGNPDLIKKSINHLTSKQNIDGSWNFLPDSPGDLITTSLAVSILNKYRNSYALDNYISKGISWLLSMQNSDGGFGDSPSTVPATASALKVFIERGQPQPEMVDRAKNYIITKQLSDGSWNESPFETAMAVNALGSLKPNLSIVPSDLYVSNKTPKAGELLTVRAVVRNIGAKAANNVPVQVFAQSSTNEIIQIGQTQIIPILPAGGSSTVEGIFDTRGREGNHTIHVKIDPDGIIDEVTKEDNEASVEIYIIGVPAE